MKKKFIFLLNAIILCLLILVMINAKIDFRDAAPKEDRSNSLSSTIDSFYLLELDRWGIYNNETHPVETTQGFNDALQWAESMDIKKVKVPSGTYLIDKDSSIEMISNVIFELDENTILKKESNGYEIYNLIQVGVHVENTIIRGGMLVGERDTHDYSQIGEHTTGTHEWGHGINITGAQNVIVENMKIEKFTGDGIYIGGVTITGSYLTESHMELGGLAANGKPKAAEGKIRTIGRTQTNFDNKAYETHRTVHMWLPMS